MTTLAPSASAASLAPPRAADRRDWLEALYLRFNHRSFVSHDPLDRVLRTPDPADREVVALLAALLAYGNVRSILRGIDALLARLGPSPHRYLLDSAPAAIRRDLRGFRYRVTSDGDLAALLIATRRILHQHGSLHAAVADRIDPSHATILPALAGFVDAMTDAAEHPLHHLLPHPDRGSACKRLHLMLRWLVRRDAVDPGGWSRVSPALLIVPLDTHMHAMARRLRLTRRATATGPTALAITAAFRRICPDDPIRYDFALTRPGILRLDPTPGAPH